MEIRRGILRDFDSGTYKAIVAMPGSLGVWLEGLAVSRDIASAEMVTGRYVAVMMFDPSNPGDAVVCAVWE